MPHRLLLLLFLLLWPFAGFACDVAVVAGRDDNAPISYEVNGRNQGIGYSLLKTALDKTATRMELAASMPWPRTLNRAKSGKIDILVGIHKTADRLPHYEYLNPPLTTTAYTVFFLKEKQDKIRSWLDLKQWQGSIVRETLSDELLAATIQEDLNLLKVGSLPQAIELLVDFQRTDFIIAPLLPTVNFIQKTQPEILDTLGFLQTPAAITDEYIAIAPL